MVSVISTLILDVSHAIDVLLNSAMFAGNSVKQQYSGTLIPVLRSSTLEHLKCYYAYTIGVSDVCLVGVFPLYQYRLCNRNNMKNPSLPTANLEIW